MFFRDKNGKTTVDVAVVGGGLSGLAAATYLARADRAVLLLEKAWQVGGRAVTQRRGDFLFNLGPHALYAAGGGMKVLQDLGVSFQGGKPALGSKAKALLDDKLYLLPQDPKTMLRTGLLGVRDKVRLMRLLAEFGMMQPESAQQLSVQAWLRDKTNSDRLRQLLLAFARLATYANAPEQLSAAVFIHQMQLVLRDNVRYLDGGWQTLVDGLRQVAEQAGVKIVTGTRVAAVNDGEAGPSLRLADESTISAAAVILAVDPETASRLVPQNRHLQQWAETAVPVRAATLDVALRRLPRPDRAFALGLDRPLYLSVHSTAAQLAPPDGVMLHVAKYLPPTSTADAEADKEQLTALLDRVQPGWRQELVDQRFLPDLVVVNRMATAAEGGFSGRPGPSVPQSRHLYIAGDWVGQQGWLVDASLASAKEAAEIVLSRTPALEETARSEPAQSEPVLVS